MEGEERGRKAWSVVVVKEDGEKGPEGGDGASVILASRACAPP